MRTTQFSGKPKQPNTVIKYGFLDNVCLASHVDRLRSPCSWWVHIFLFSTNELSFEHETCPNL